MSSYEIIPPDSSEDNNNTIQPVELDQLDEEDLQNVLDFENSMNEYEESNTTPLYNYKNYIENYDENNSSSENISEIWHAVSRNCPCCKGFRCGCQCLQAGNVPVCQNDNCLDQVFLEKMKTNYNNKPKVNKEIIHTNSSYSHSSIPSHENSYHDSSSNIVYCRFENSPSGCRFGVNCRFQHRNL